jgi:GT2 family glycosyltransferase
MEHKKLSIIIAAYHKSSILSYGLASIQDQKVSCPYEILVINDGYNDDTENICQCFPELPIRYIFTGQRNYLTSGVACPVFKWRCPGFAINVGIKRSMGELILLQQPEICYLTNNCINDMVNAVENDAKKIAFPLGKNDTGSQLKLLDSGSPLSVLEFVGTTLDTSLPFCMMMHKSAIVDIGGYDEDMIGYCHDDIDIVGRLAKSGCSFNLINSHKIIHLYHSRTVQARIGLSNRNESWLYNKKICDDKKDIIIRNQGREWGCSAENKVPPLQSYYEKFNIRPVFISPYKK